MKIRRFNTILLMSVYLLSFAVISYLYISDIAPVWGYYGYREVIDFWKISYSVIFIIMWSIFFRPQENVSDMIILFSTLLYVIPTFVIYSFGGGSDYMQLLVVGSISIILLASKIHIPRPKMQPIPQPVFFGIILIFALVTIAAQATFSGFSTFSLDIFSVYEFRLAAADSVPAIFGYIMSMTGKVLLPMGFVMSFYFRSTIMAIIFSVLTIVYFGLSQHKSVLFGPILVYIVYIMAARYGGLKSIVYFFIVTFAFLSVNHIYINFYSLDPGQNLATSLILRRFFLVPPLIDGFYLDFFTGGAKYYWSTSNISLGFVDNPYGAAAPALIGEKYFHSSEIWANSGLIGSGYSNAGILGVGIYSLAFGLILSILNGHGKFIGYEFVYAISLTVCLSIVTSTDIVTSVLSHGILLLLILLIFFPKQRIVSEGGQE